MLKIEKGCTINTPKCEYSMWNKGAGIGLEMKPCCIKHQREIIWYLTDLFEEENIFYWADFGTLLGAIREGRSIPHDTDGDLCLYGRDRIKIIKLRDRINNDGFWMGATNITRTRWKDGHIKIYRSKTNHMCVDLFFWKHDKKNNIMVSGGLNRPKSFPTWWIEKLEKVTIFDKEIWAPREPRKFLRMRFGIDWRRPQNKKVHFRMAERTHIYGFNYAAKYGWGNDPQKRKIKFLE